MWFTLDSWKTDPIIESASHTIYAHTHVYIGSVAINYSVKISTYVLDYIFNFMTANALSHLNEFEGFCSRHFVLH